MSNPTFFVRASWDAQAEVWVSETDIPGLVIEADSLAEFEQLIFALAPDLLNDNLGLPAGLVTIDFQATARRHLNVA
jgi:hypothetical protein